MSTPTLTEKDYNHAMNLVGQNLLKNLSESVNQLPQPLRDHKVIAQSLSAFLANVILKQAGTHADNQQKMLADLVGLVNHHLKSIANA